MARIRTLKPEFFNSPSTAEADLAVRLTFMAMWNWADDSGHGTANIKELEAFCWPNDEVTELPRMGRGNSGDTPGTWRNFAEICGEVAEVFGVVFYRVRNRPYYWIPSFKQHQSKDFRETSRYPLLEDGEKFDVTSGKTIPADPGDQPTPGDSAPMRGKSAPSGGSAALGTGEQGNRGTEDQGRREAAPQPPPREDVEQVCTMFADLCESTATNGKRPTITKAWRDAARRLIDIDGRTVDDIERIARWAQADDFWVSNVRSLPKLREKFETLTQQAQRPTRQQQARPNRDITSGMSLVASHQRLYGGEA